MIDIAQLREALTAHQQLCDAVDGYYLGDVDSADVIATLTAVEPTHLHHLADAAKELLTLREAGALIITPDEIVDTLSNVPLVERIAQVAGIDKRTVALDILDALRDAMPDGDT